jgi:hypothetical protein
MVNDLEWRELQLKYHNSHHVLISSILCGDLDYTKSQELKKEGLNMKLIDANKRNTSAGIINNLWK